MMERVSAPSLPPRAPGVGRGIGDVGRGVGANVGRGVGANTGAAVGFPGVAVGDGVGRGVGPGVGLGVGPEVGLGVGNGFPGAVTVIDVTVPSKVRIKP